MSINDLSELDQHHVDVAIIGGGINGASTAQHLSAAGYRVLVVDQDDFANGATSRSSRLLHCGLRHLASGSGFWRTLMRPRRLATSLKSVRDDMRARDDIVRTIPSRVKPINFCLPIYADDQYTPWQLDAAFAALRLTSLRGIPLKYRRHRPKQFSQVPVSPWLRDPGNLRSIAVFQEYLFDWPERIALDALFDARRMGAIIRNYTRVLDVKRHQADGRWHLTLQSTEQADQRSFASVNIAADLVLNLAGAWVDEVITKTGSNATPKCRGMKGIHIAVRLPEEFQDWGVFTYNSRGVFTYNSTSEPLYCLPFRGIHYVGLTRTPFAGEIASVRATDREIDWMISETNRCFPKLALERNDVLFTWAGVNPLSRDPDEPSGSREIKVHDLVSDGLPGMLTLTGGPIITHRRVAQRLTKEVLSKLGPRGKPQIPFYRNDQTTCNESQTDRGGGKSMVTATEVTRCARDEMPASLADMLMRRLGVGWDPDQGCSEARLVAEIAAPYLGWSEARIECELAAFQAHLDNARRKPSL